MLEKRGGIGKIILVEGAAGIVLEVGVRLMLSLL